MAKRKKSVARRMPKIEPAVHEMFFPLSVPPGATVLKYIDWAQCASLCNRRAYRQGLLLPLAGMKVLSGTKLNTAGSTVSLQVNKLPSTWVFSNAWHKSFSTWQRMNAEALEETESIRPRFLDFKIYMNSIHHAAGFGLNLLPTDSAGAFPTVGEWEASKMVIPKTDGTDGVHSRELIGTGTNYPGAGASGLDAVSLIEGYAASRGLPNVLDPNVPDDASLTSGNTPQNWMQATFNEGTDQSDIVLDDLSTENNIAPYPFENDGVNIDTMYPGGANQLPGLQRHSVDFVTSTTIGGVTRIPGGLFPCGLIELRFTNTDDVPHDLIIRLETMPGTHRGYTAVPMQDM